MLPYLGAGAGQGLEDVYALCRLLSHSTTTKSNLDVLYIIALVLTRFQLTTLLQVVIKVYDTIRRPRANMILERSMRAGVIYNSFGPNHYNAEDMRRHLVGMMEPVWFHDLEAEVTEEIEAMGKTI